jgi:hypothetical protein
MLPNISNVYVRIWGLDVKKEIIIAFINSYDKLE